MVILISRIGMHVPCEQICKQPDLTDVLVTLRDSVTEVTSAG